LFSGLQNWSLLTSTTPKPAKIDCQKAALDQNMQIGIIVCVTIIAIIAIVLLLAYIKSKKYYLLNLFRYNYRDLVEENNVQEINLSIIDISHEEKVEKQENNLSDGQTWLSL
jgi:hypothetical protein